MDKFRLGCILGAVGCGIVIAYFSIIDQWERACLHDINGNLLPSESCTWWHVRNGTGMALYHFAKILAYGGALLVGFASFSLWRKFNRRSFFVAFILIVAMVPLTFYGYQVRQEYYAYSGMGDVAIQKLRYADFWTPIEGLGYLALYVAGLFLAIGLMSIVKTLPSSSAGRGLIRDGLIWTTFFLVISFIFALLAPIPLLFVFAWFAKISPSISKPAAEPLPA